MANNERDLWKQAREIVNRRTWGNLRDDVVVKRCHDTAVAIVFELLRADQVPAVPDAPNPLSVYVARARAAGRAPQPWQLNGASLEEATAGRWIR